MRGLLIFEKIAGIDAWAAIVLQFMHTGKT